MCGVELGIVIADFDAVVKEDGFGDVEMAGLQVWGPKMLDFGELEMGRAFDATRDIEHEWSVLEIQLHSKYQPSLTQNRNRFFHVPRL